MTGTTAQSAPPFPGMAAPQVAIVRRPASPPAPPAASYPVLTWLRIHALTILFCGSLLGAGFAALAWTLIPAKAESYALLQVASAPSYVAYQNDPQRARTDFATYLKTTAQLIKSDFVLNRALNDEKFGVAKLDTLQGIRDPLLFLDEQLQVSWTDGNEIIRISMKSENPEDARKIVNAVQSAFMKEVVEREVLTKKNLLEKVRVAKVELSDTIKRKGGISGNDTAVAQGAAATPPAPLPPNIVAPGAEPVKQAAAAIPAAPVIGDSLRRSVADQLLKKIHEYDDQLVYLPSLVRDRERKREQLKKQIESALNDPAKADAVAAAERDPEVQVLRGEAKRARAEYTHYRSLASNPDAPSVLAYKERADALDAQADKLKAVKAKELESARRVAATSQLDQQLGDNERDLSRLKEQIEVAVILRDRAKKEFNELPPEVVKDEPKGPPIDPAKTDLVAHNVLLDRVTQQEIALDFELASATRITQLQPASTALIRESKKQIIAAGIAGLMGFALVGLLALGYETRVRKVSSLGDVAGTVPVPVVGTIPHAPSLRTMNDPLKRADVVESLERLRTFVAQSWLPRGAKIIAVTSPLGDEGKAMTAYGLAESLARSGTRTLIVDFDLRSPAIHRFAHIDPSRGVCELLRGQAQPSDTVLSLPSGLYVLPAGTWTNETRHVAAGERLKALVELLSQPFDCVVMHTHALLTTAESVEVAQRAQAVLICTQYRESRMPLVTRAVDRIQSMGIDPLGLVYVGASKEESLR